jgi:hypothetical protein
MNSTTKPDHNKIINAAAKKVLKPLGLVRDGGSRVWHDDHGWWMTKVEFQPSGWSKGSYLNVGVCWLLYEGNSNAFNVGHRVDVPFAEFTEGSDFEREMTVFASRASDEVLRYRDVFSTLHKAADYYRNKQSTFIWDKYFSGVILGLCDEIAEARRFLGAVVSEATSPLWQRALAQRATDLMALLSDRSAFRSSVTGIVLRTRSIGVLPDVEDVRFE